MTFIDGMNMRPFQLSWAERSYKKPTEILHRATHAGMVWNNI
jgi:hypothetical protein